MVSLQSLSYLEVDLAGEGEGLMEPFFRCVRDGAIIGHAEPRFVDGKLKLRKLTLPKGGAAPFTFQFWAADDYDEPPRLLGSVELAPVTPPEPPMHVAGAPLLIFVEDQQAPEHTAFTLSCTIEAFMAGPVKGEEVVPKELIKVVTIPPKPKPKPPPAAPSRKSLEEGMKEPPPPEPEPEPTGFNFVSGNKYLGQLEGSTMIGEGAFEWCASGVSYEGTFKANTLSGVGKYVWADGSTYVGEVLDGLRHGVGTFTAPGGSPSYEGEWAHGLRHGKGVLCWADGAKYDGAWAADLKHGYGVMTYANGNVYEGHWVDDLKEGPGTMHWLTLRERYVGTWLGGEQHGFGEHTWLRLQNESTPFQMRERYSGEWVHGQRHGNGVFFFANGSRYEGYWEYNRKSGVGTFTFEDGSVYEGAFSEDRMVGSKVTPQPDLYGRLDFDMVMGPQEPERDLAIQAVQHMLLRHNTELKQIYRYYAAYACPGSEAFVLSLGQFWQFVRDTRLMSPRLPLAQIDRIMFSHVKSAELTPPEAPEVVTELPPLIELQALVMGMQMPTDRHVPHDDHMADRPLLLREFIQGLIVLATHVRPRSPQPLQPGQLAYPQQLRALIDQDVLPRACRPPPPQSANAKAAKGLTAEPPPEPPPNPPNPLATSSAALPVPYAPTTTMRLRLVYSYYARRASEPRFRRGKRDATLTVRELLMILRDSEMLPVAVVLQPLFVSILPPLYTERLASIDLNLAADGEAADELEDALAEVMELELIYSEFEDAIRAFIAGHEAEGLAPWDPPPPAEPEVPEGEEGAPEPEPEPEPEPAAAEGGGEEGEEGAEAAPAPEPEEPPEPPDLLLAMLLPNVAAKMMLALEELAGVVNASDFESPTGEEDEEY